MVIQRIVSINQPLLQLIMFANLHGWQLVQHGLQRIFIQFITTQNTACQKCTVKGIKSNLIIHCTTCRNRCL